MSLPLQMVLLLLVGLAISLIGHHYVRPLWVWIGIGVMVTAFWLDVGWFIWMGWFHD